MISEVDFLELDWGEEAPTAAQENIVASERARNDAGAEDANDDEDVACRMSTDEMEEAQMRV